MHNLIIADALGWAVNRFSEVSSQQKSDKNPTDYMHIVRKQVQKELYSQNYASR